MISLLFLLPLPILIALFVVKRMRNRTNTAHVIKISDNVWMTPNGIVDFTKPVGLTPEQKAHNDRLDWEIRQTELEFQHREEEARLRNEWFRKTYPDAPETTKATYGINVIGRRKVIGFRYVE